MTTELQAADKIAALLREAREIAGTHNFESLANYIDDTIHDEASPLVNRLEEEDELRRGSPYETMVAQARSAYLASVL